MYSLTQFFLHFKSFQSFIKFIHQRYIKPFINSIPLTGIKTPISRFKFVTGQLEPSK
jgi:hypothetical protein